MKKTILFLIVCFLAAGWWQDDKIADFLKNTVDFSWLSFAETDYAASRARYMQQGTGAVKVAFIHPDESSSFMEPFFQDMVKGAALAAELVEKKNKTGRKIELVVTTSVSGYETIDLSILSLGEDPAVVAVILPYNPHAKQDSEVFAEYMGMLIFHFGHMFASREVGSYLAFSNSYSFDQFSKKIARYSKQRGLQSVMMITEKSREAEGYAKNQDFWFSKEGVPVATGFLYEKDMINGPMLNKLNKKIDIFNIDSVYWGSVLGTHLASIDDSIKHLPVIIGQKTQHLMFLPVVVENNQTVMKRLQLIEASALDPIIAYPVIEDAQQKAKFDRLYYEKYKIKANHTAYYGYDTFMLLSSCILEDNTASTQKIAQLLTKKSYTGILAQYGFKKDGTLKDQVADNIKLGRVKNGVLVELDMASVKPAETREEIEKRRTINRQ